MLTTLCAADVTDGVAALAAGRKGDVSKAAAAMLVLGGLVVLVPQVNELRAG